MVTTASGGELLSNSRMPSNTFNFLQNTKGEILEKAGQTAGTIAETASKIKATLPGATETAIHRVTETGSQVMGKGAETVGSAKTAIIDGAQKTLNATVYNWLNTHPLLSWFLTHPLYTIGAILLTLLLFSGLFRAFGRLSEQAWVFILHSPFKLSKWLLGFGTKTLVTRPTITNSSKSDSQARLVEIMSRLENIRQEEDILMQEVKTILSLEKK